MTIMSADTEIIEGTSVAVDIKRPKMYCVVLYNDDTTTFDFVHTALVRIFHRTSEEAAEITQAIHNGGSGIAGGPYTHEVAEEKHRETILFARTNGFALAASVDEV